MRRALVFAALGATLASAPAGATFHLMQIEKVVGGVGADATAQAIQLRTRASGQCFVQQARVRVFDAAGLNPIVIQDFSSCPPIPNPCISTCPPGARILIASPSFLAALDAPIAADQAMQNLIPPEYLAAGSLVFEDASGTFVYWRISWGGASYTGPNGVACDNDDTPCPSPGSVAPPFAGPLPSLADMALEFQGAATALSTTNAADYEISAGAAAFTNNAGQSGTIKLAAPCPWDCEAAPNGAVGTSDLLALLAAWGRSGPCDVDGGGVGTSDLLALLASWGGCP